MWCNVFITTDLGQKARLLELLFCQGRSRRLQSSLSPPSYPFWGGQWRNKQGWMQSEIHFAVYCHLGHYSLDKLSFLFLLLSFTQYVSLISGVSKEKMCEKMCLALTPETVDPETECGGRLWRPVHDAVHMCRLIWTNKCVLICKHGEIRHQVLVFCLFFLLHVCSFTSSPMMMNVIAVAIYALLHSEQETCHVSAPRGVRACSCVCVCGCIHVRLRACMSDYVFNPCPTFDMVPVDLNLSSRLFFSPVWLFL